MVEEATVRRLLEVIEVRLQRLLPITNVKFSEYAADITLQDRAERNLQVCIQACIDLGAHVLADLSKQQPGTNRAVFRELVNVGLIDAELGSRLEAMAGFRNILVHGYTDILADRVYESLKDLGDIREFVRQLGVYLENQGVI